MADWTVTWAPSFGYSFRPEYHTLISPFEDGGEQRRQKRTRAKFRFTLSFDARVNATIDAIIAFFHARGGAYSSFNFPSYGQRIKGSGLACTNDNPDTITDSGTAFVTRGFSSTLDVWIAGSGQSNDGVYDIASVAAGTITLAGGESLTAESSNADLIVYPCYVVRFVEDQFIQQFINNDHSRVRTVELVEVI